MSDSTIARHLDIQVFIDGADVSESVVPYLQALTYTDNEEDKTDDLQMTVDDREFLWLEEWLNTPAQPAAPAEAPADDGGGFKVGDSVIANGQPQYTSYGEGNPGTLLKDHQGTVTYMNPGAPYPVHVDQKGWFAEGQVQKVNGDQEDQEQAGEDPKGAELHVVLIQKNWYSDGRDKVLDCGIFEMDTINASGPPAKVSLKGTSLPHTAPVRKQKKTQGWEKLKLSAIANEIAGRNGLTCMYLSSYDPMYERKEQVQQSDISFLKELCKAAGVSLKATAKMLVLFDAAEYEAKDAVRQIARGSSDVLSWNFSTNFNDTAYSSCRVSYMNPTTGKPIEHTYTPRDADKDGQVLEINEKVNSKEEARQLAMKRLRQKNKSEYEAEFTLVGDLDLVAGVTVELVGWGMFNGKYIIETATHKATGGYTVTVKLRRVLEGY